MRERITMMITFLLSLPIALVSFLILFFNVNMISKKLIYDFVFIIALLNFTIAIISIRKLMIEVKHDKKVINHKEKNVRDFYQYTQLLDPPEMNN